MLMIAAICPPRRQSSALLFQLIVDFIPFFGRTTEQPLRTIEQPLRITEQPLRTTEQPLRTTEQPLCFEVGRLLTFYR